MTVTEIGQPNLPPMEGYVGNLTSEQEDKLREMWDGYFDWCAKASGNAQAGGKASAFDDDAGNDPKKAGIPKGDAAKEEAKKQEEEAGLRALLEEYGPDSLKRALWEFIKFDNPDGIFLRFLRARKWDVTRALGMFASCLKWRLDNDVESLVREGDLGNGKKIEKFLDQQRSGKTYALGTAVNEQPICYIHVKKHLTFGQPGSSMQKYVIYAMESFRLLMMPPGDKVILFFDLTGFGLKNMDWNCILFIVKCLEAFYPESLGILYIHNAPWIFSGIWKILGPLLDPVVRSKVAFTKGPKDVEDRVPAERLIADLGGNVTTGFEFVEPEEGENDKVSDKAKGKEVFDAYMKIANEYEDTTREWIKAGGGSKDAEIQQRRTLLYKKLRVAQFEMEPYARGLTVYHRNNTIDGQGKVTWHYIQKDGNEIRHVAGRKTCVATLRREIREMEQGASAEEVEKRSDDALERRDWIALYGDRKTAEKLEGPIEGADDEPEPEERPQPQRQKSGSRRRGEEEAVAAGAAAGGVAMAAGRSARSARSRRYDDEDGGDRGANDAPASRGGQDASSQPAQYPKQAAREADQTLQSEDASNAEKAKAVPKKAIAGVAAAAGGAGAAMKKLKPKKKRSGADAQDQASQQQQQQASAQPEQKQRKTTATGLVFKQRGPDDAEEVEQAAPDLPEGGPGNMDDEQLAKLREMWDGYFDWCAKASGNAQAGSKATAFGDDAANDPKKAGIPKGDAAKEEAKKAEEEAGLQALLKEYGPDSLKQALWEFIKMDDPDGIFCRFLRARKWDVTRAMGMFASCLKWRLDNDVESLVREGDLGNGEKIEKFLDQQRSGKTYALGTAINEQPICYIHVKKHLTFGQPGSSMQKYVIYAMESFRLLMQPPQEKVILFFDLTGFGLKNMDWNCILFIVKCLEAFYPESLGILYIHNAPWIFSGIWKILGPLLDPVVRSKVAFTKGPKDVEDRVPAERLIADLGGNVTTGFDFIEPKDGENDKQKDKATKEKMWKNYMNAANEYEEITRKWIETDGKDEKVWQKRMLLKKKLRVAHFEQEPWIRGLTVYHRNDTIDGQGKVTWLYEQKGGKTYRHVVGRKTCVATLRREISEMEEGKTAAEVEKKSAEAAKKRDWVALYGDEETAFELEGTKMSEKPASAPQQAPRQQAQQQQTHSQDEEDDEEEEEEEDGEDEHENRGVIAGVAAAAGGAAAGAAAGVTAVASGAAGAVGGAASAITGYFTGGNNQAADDDEDRAPSSRRTPAQTPGVYEDAPHASTPALEGAHDAERSLSGRAQAPASKGQDGIIDYSARRRRNYDEDDEEVAPAAASRQTNGYANAAPRQQPVSARQEPEPQQQQQSSTNGILGGLAGAGSGIVSGLAGTLGYGNANGNAQDQNGHATNGRATNGYADDVHSSPREPSARNGSVRRNVNPRHYDDYSDEDEPAPRAGQRALNGSSQSYGQKNGTANGYGNGNYANVGSARRRSQIARAMGDNYYGGADRRLSAGPKGYGASSYGKEPSLVTDPSTYQPNGGSDGAGLGRRLSRVFKK